MEVFVDRGDIFGLSVFFIDLVGGSGGHASGHEEPGEPAVVGVGPFGEELGEVGGVGFVIVLESN